MWKDLLRIKRYNTCVPKARSNYASCEYTLPDIGQCSKEIGLVEFVATIPSGFVKGLAMVPLHWLKAAYIQRL